ncbi:putative dipeptidyl-aminopeptidase B [Escovopsis weberi]|uniref:Probable dipeptidyl-aminopeptidase B n=1 Tax=Escovopsis weberi TaxID=150374 RepID=A0A0M9VUD8_ESCWE|nr:putative dipeptidyl-aminopeptidase B [Escovopsis weberi]
MAPPNPGSPDDALQHQPRDSLSSVSTTSIVFDHIQEETEKTDAAERRRTSKNREDVYAQVPLPSPHDEDALDDAETGAFLGSAGAGIQQRPMHRSLRRVLIIVAVVFVAGWALSLAVFLSTGSYKHASDSEHDPDATTRGSGKPITMDQLFNGHWSAKKRSLQWIAGQEGEDGLLLETGAAGKDFMVVEHVQTTIGGGGGGFGSAARADAAGDALIPPPRTLMQNGTFVYAGRRYVPSWTRPSPDLSRVLIGVEKRSVWRHSFTAIYFILDVATQSAHPLIPSDVAARVQLATWSPASDAVAFTRDNNLYIRSLTGAGDVVQVSEDGGPEYFYGIPDWVYEEEVFSGNTATWWSDDGKYLAFLRTNETAVPEYTLQYFVSRPSGTLPAPGEELYPEQRRIKYPKAGAHNPVVDLLFYDVARGDSFAVTIEDEFADDDRIINSLVWAGDKALVKETNRVSDVLKVILVDVGTRQGRTVNTVDVNEIDGGWFEISHGMTFVPADPANGRPHDGYVDTVIHDGYDHLAYFAPLDSSAPVMLTSGPWEVVKAPSAVDLANNLVYFVATRESSIQRHVYSVRLDGSGLASLTNTSAEAYYAASFSPRAGYALLDYQGPRVPFQKVVSTPPNAAARYDAVVEDNRDLAERARRHQLPVKRYGTLALAPNVSANFVERRPPHFDPARRYPALFFQYSGPGSQQVHKQFLVDFQSYVASALGYVVITIDPRGTGFAGRAHRVPVRSRIGVLEAQDHINAARHFAALPYIDPARLCIWGWSYGGFQTLKTLEADAGRTFAYGMAVAPVTDWRFYDSIYAERYMRSPADNKAGYDASKVANATALGLSKRFLIMHGVADDNVHFQNSLTLLDDLDLAGVENYDVHVFPDSDHSIYFHGASRVVYDKLSNWLINAFNGEWLRIANAKPNTE